MFKALQHVLTTSTEHHLAVFSVRPKTVASKQFPARIASVGHLTSVIKPSLLKVHLMLMKQQIPLPRLNQWYLKDFQLTIDLF